LIVESPSQRERSAELWSTRGVNIPINIQSKPKEGSLLFDGAKASAEPSGRDAEAASGTAVTERDPLFSDFSGLQLRRGRWQERLRNGRATTGRPMEKSSEEKNEREGRRRGRSVRGEEAEEDKEQKTLALGSYEDK